MKALEMANSMALFVATTFVVAFCYVAYRISERVVESIHPVAFTIAGTTILFSLVSVIVAAARFIVEWMSIRARQIQPKGGLYPYMHDNGQYINLNEAGAQNLAVVASLTKLTPAVAQKLVEKQIQEQSPVIQIPQKQNVRLDLCKTPHWLLIGTTGSGKTSASYDILSRIASLFDCQFVITEPGGVNWGNQATATKTLEIAETIICVADEMQRRQELLGKNDVDHVKNLPQPLPFLFLVTEETDSVLDDLRLIDREMRTKTIVAIRSIARMGRKAGVCMMAVSQSGTTDVFDSHVRKNMSNVLLFRSEHTVAEAWRIGEKLGNLKPGEAFSLMHNDVVQFDNCPRPQLPLFKPGKKDTEKRDNCRLQAVGEELQRLERGEQPDQQLAVQLRRLYDEGCSKTELCRKVWGYKDGTTFELLNNALASA